MMSAKAIGKLQDVYAKLDERDERREKGRDETNSLKVSWRPRLSRLGFRNPTRAIVNLAFWVCLYRS